MKKPVSNWEVYSRQLLLNVMTRFLKNRTRKTKTVVVAVIANPLHHLQDKTGCALFG